MIALPTKITATRTATYDISKIIEDILDGDIDKNKNDITLEEIMEYVDEWATEDLGSAYREIYYTNQDGQEINK